MKKYLFELIFWIFGGWLSLLTGLFFKFKGDSMYELGIFPGTRPKLYRIPIEHNYYSWSKLFYVLAVIFLLLFIYQLVITIIKLKRPK